MTRETGLPAGKQSLEVRKYSFSRVFQVVSSSLFVSDSPISLERRGYVRANPANVLVKAVGAQTAS